MKKTLLFSMLIFSLAMQSQNFQWADFPAVIVDSNPDSTGYSVCTDNSGSIYYTGYKDTKTVNSDIFGNVFYRKFNASGTLLFEKNFLGKVSVYNIVADANDNVFVALYYFNSITIDSFTLNTGGTTKHQILLKFDSLGNLLWHKKIKDLNATISNFKAIAVDTNNNIFVGYDNFSSSFITKFDENGSLQFTITQQNVGVISSISIDNSGNIFVAGSCASSNSQFAGVLQSTSLSYPNYVVKYSSTGVHQWTKYIQDITCVEPKIATKNGTDVYFSGTLSGAFSFDAIVAQGPLSGSSDDIFVAKLNGNGDFQWVREVPGAGKASVGKRNFLTVDNANNVYFAGKTGLTVAWGNGVTTSISGNYRDVLLLKYNSNGDVLMAKTAGGTSYDDRSDGVAVDNLDNIYLSGIAYGNTVFDAISNTSSSVYYPYLTKISSALATTNFNQNNFSIYPNPAQTELHFSNIENTSKGLIYNLLGQKIASFKIENNLPINISNLSNGVYVLEIEGLGKTKFIKN